jgi:hypothetical protein
MQVSRVKSVDNTPVLLIETRVFLAERQKPDSPHSFSLGVPASGA